MSTREELLACPLEKEKVDLPGGKSAWVRGLSAGESQLLKGASDSKFFAFCVIREDGARVFDPNDPADIALIDRMPVAIVRAAVKAILRLSGYFEDPAKN